MFRALPLFSQVDVLLTNVPGAECRWSCLRGACLYVIDKYRQGGARGREGGDEEMWEEEDTDCENDRRVMRRSRTP